MGVDYYEWDDGISDGDGLSGADEGEMRGELSDGLYDMLGARKCGATALVRVDAHLLD